MIDDAILSREAYLIYNNNTGFTPINGNLMKWEGMIQFPNGKHMKLYITLPEDFPRAPPRITSDSRQLTQEIYNRIKTIHRWKPHYHVYQVIWEVIQLANKGLIKPPVEQYSRSHDTTLASSEELLKQLLSQRNQLQAQLNEKRQFLQSLQSQATPQTSTTSLKQVLMDSKTEVEQDLFILETQQENAEINDLEFAKKFVELRTRLALLDMQIEKCT